MRAYQVMVGRGISRAQYVGNPSSLLVPKPTPSTEVLRGHLPYHPNKMSPQNTEPIHLPDPTLSAQHFAPGKCWKNPGPGAMAQPPMGPRSSAGPSLALSCCRNNGPLWGPHSLLSPQLTHRAPSKNRPGQAVSPPAWDIRIQIQAPPSPVPPNPWVTPSFLSRGARFGSGGKGVLSTWWSGNYLSDRYGTPSPGWHQGCPGRPHSRGGDE